MPFIDWIRVEVVLRTLTELVGRAVSSTSVIVAPKIGETDASFVGVSKGEVTIMGTDSGILFTSLLSIIATVEISSVGSTIEGVGMVDDGLLVFDNNN